MKRLSIATLVLLAAWPLQAATKAVTLEIRGWTCGSCASATRIALKKLGGVQDVATDPDKGEAIVTYDDSKVTTATMIQAVEKLGYKASVESAGMTASTRPASTIAPAMKDPSPPPALVSFYEVPLECGASEGLGCGSAAKPILSELGRNPRITDARINHPGTVIAVTWKDRHDRSDSVVEAVFDKHHLAAAALEGRFQEKALAEFRSERWYTAADVDVLSEHEARVIAARLVNRSHVDLPPGRLLALTEDLAVILARHLTNRDVELDSRKEIIKQELAKAASKHLNPQQLAELRKSGEQGIAALPGEDK